MVYGAREEGGVEKDLVGGREGGVVGKEERRGDLRAERVSGYTTGIEAWTNTSRTTSWAAGFFASASFLSWFFFRRESRWPIIFLIRNFRTFFCTPMVGAAGQSRV